MIPDANQTPDTSEAAAEAEPVAVPAATAVSSAVDAAAVESEARVSSPPLATLTIVMPVTPVVIAPLLPEPTSVIQVMPSGDDHTVSQSTDTVLGTDTDSVCGVQSDTSVSVCRVQPPPLSPVSVLSSSSSDVCIVAVEITPVKPRPENRPDARSLNAGGTVLPHTIKIDVDGSENISGDEFSRAVTSDNVDRDIESECFVDSLPTLQMLTLRAINESETSLSSPSHSDIAPPLTVRDTDILTSSKQPIVIVDSSDSETSVPAIDSVNSIQSKQSSSHQIPKKTHAINSESAHPSAVSSSHGVCKPVASETRWVKVGRSAAAQAITGPSTKNSVVSSSRNVLSDATAGLAGKRRIIEITPVGDANSKAPPSKKICTRADAAAPNTAVSARLPTHLKKLTSPGFVSSAIRNVVLVPKTNKLNPTPETVVTPVVNLSEKDLRSVVVNLHNEKVMNPSDRSASGRSVCEGDNLRVSGDNQRVSGDGKNRVDSRRGRSESQGSTRGGSVGGRGGVTDRGGVSDRGVSERDSRKDCGDARPPSSSRSERENDSRHGNGSRSSSSRGGHDVRSRSSAEDVRSRSSVEDVRSRSSAEDVRPRSSAEDARSRSSVEDVRSRSSVEDVRSWSSVSEVDESRGRDGSHKVCIRCI